MLFSYDSSNSLSNKEKHGIDFVEAQEIWADSQRIRFETNHHHGEERELVVGEVNNKLWVAVVTSSGNQIRIISVRRARKKEVLYYDKANNNSRI